VRLPLLLISFTPLLVLACGGAEGPQLPGNVGSTHRSTSGGRTPDVGAPPTRHEAGHAVWANRRGSGFFFHGTVVEVREEDGRRGHRVVYDDGGWAWLGQGALRPGQLEDGATLQVRDAEGRFTTASALRQLGPALYLRFATGMETWAALPHVRLPEDGPSLPSASAASEAAEANAETVWVDYQLQGLLFPAVVTAARDDGAQHVVYRDGVTEWVRPPQVFDDRVGEGTTVHVRRRMAPADWVRGRVDERIGEACRVTYDNGGQAWTSLYRLRVAVEDMPTAE
jgi:hypothetical protein